ncbi:unnamed protein product [Sphagnum jensenii]|uniref:Pentatricopeptide repeat-containing protein n=1 Tax=Sphagnum jensenii TaxID=128206 RepID=A0ABP0WGC5_9BRYO
MAMRQRLTLESRCSGLIASCGYRALVSSWSGHVGKAASGHTEKVWREFFSDPSQWWDCRPEKVNARYPDFKHKKTQDALWLGDRRNPPWVAAGVAAMAPGTVQMDSFSWNRRLAKYVKTGEYEKTMELFKQMQKRGMRPDKFTFVPVLNACAGLRALEEGRRAHQLIMQTGCEADVFVGSSLVDMYAKCGSMEDAWRVFCKMPSQDVVTWTAMILGCVRCGQGEKALELYKRMQQEGVQPNAVTFKGVLNACASLMALEEGRSVHQQMIQCACHLDAFVGSSLVDMYAKCGSMEDAWSVFNKMPSRDAVTWTAMILGHVNCGQGQKALDLFHQMQEEGVQPDAVTFVGVLNACASLMALEEGRSVHQQMIQCACHLDAFVGSSLVDMYAKCGSIEEASRVFNKLPSQAVVCWTAMIFGHVKYGEGHKALDLFHQMQEEGVQPDAVTFVGVLNACASIMALEEGRYAHEQIIQNGCESDAFVGSSLIAMYAKCGSMEEASRVFNKLPSRAVVWWTAMIFGHVKCGEGHKALDLFHQMQEEGVQPDAVTFVGVLNACASIMALEEGRYAHEQIIQNGCESDAFVGSSLIAMYAKCGSIGEASRVFNKLPSRAVVWWTAMIFGHVKCGEGHKALELFQKMQQEGVQPDPATYVGVLNACASIMALEEGRYAHEQIIQNGCESDAFVGSSLIAMYAKCGSMEEASRVFNKLPSRAVVWWTAMIFGHVKCGEGHKALELFQKMQQEGVQPDPATYVGVLNACANVVALEEGRRAHERIIQSRCESDVFVRSSLVDMYAKCGSMEDACRVFNTMPSHDVVSWNALLGGFAMHGQGKEALVHFERMCEEGVHPDDITFVCLLSACSHSGFVDEGLRFYALMTTVYRFPAKLEHYTCMVDLLGRAGHLQEAENMIQGMPCKPNAAIWMALLGACRIHGNVEMGERMAKRVLELEPKNAAGFVLL